MSKKNAFVLLLIDFDKAISWPSSSRVIDTALSFFLKTFKLNRVSITLLNNDHSGYTIYTLDTAISSLTNQPFVTLSKTERQGLLTHRTPSYFPDLNAQAKLTPTEKALAIAGIKSYLMVPLLVGDDLLGSLNLNSMHIDGVDAETQQLSALLSSRLALALFHAKLHDDLKSKEQQLITSEQNYRDLIDQAGDAILKGNPQGEIIQANSAASLLFGYTQAELLSLNISALFRKSVLKDKPLRYDLLQRGKTILVERTLQCKDGSSLSVEMNSKKLKDGSYISIIRDLTDRYATHQKISDQEMQIKALFDAVPAPLYAKDKQGKYTFLNSAYLDFFGKTAEDLIGKTVKQCWPKTLASRFEEDDRLLLEENKRQTYFSELKHAHKGLRQIQIFKARYYDTQGEVAGFIGTLWDITELKTAEERYSTLFTYSPDPIVVHNGQNILTANDAALKFFRAKHPKEYFSKPLSELIHPESRQDSQKRIQTVLSKNKPNDLSQQKYIISTGEVRDVEVMSVPIDYEGQRVIMTSFRDITEQKRDRDRLHASEENFRNLFEANPSPVVVHVDGTIVYANQAALHFGGKEKLSDFLGQNVFSFVHEDYRQMSIDNALQIQKTGKASPPGEQFYLGAKGELRQVESRGIPITFEGEKAIMVAFRDVTEESQTRKALLNSEERYRRSFVYSPTAMLLHDHGVLVDANNAALNFAGSLPLTGLVGMDLFQLIHPDFRNEAQVGVEELLNSDEPGTIREQKYLTLSGEERWVEAVGVPVFQGDRSLILLSFNDIHDRVIARQQLEQSRRQLQLITENVTHFILLADINLNALYMNTAALNWFRFDPENYVGTPLENLFNKKLLEEATRFIPNLLHGEVCQFAHKHDSKKGRLFDFLVTLIPVKGQAGDVIAFLAQIEDVSDRETARRELAENKELLELIVDTIPGLFSYADINQKYLYVNQAYADWNHKDRSAIIGKTLKQVLSAETYRHIRPYLSGIKKGEEQFYTRQVTDPVGSTRDFDIRYIPHFDTDHKPKAFLTSIQDVTEQKVAESHQGALRELAQSLTTGMDPHQVGKVSAKSIRRAFKSDALTIELYDHDSKLVRGIYSEDTLLNKAKPQEISTSNIPFSQLSPPWLNPKFEASCINRNAQDLRKNLNTIPFGDNRLSQSLLFVPLRWEGTSIGMVSVQSYTTGQYSPQDLSVFQSYVDQIGGALIRAQRDTQLREHQKNLEREEEKYRSIIENAGDAVFVTTLKGDIQTVNEQACSSLGYTHQDFFQMNLRDLDPKFFSLLGRKQLLALKTQDHSITLQSQQLRKDQSVFPVEFRVSITLINKRQHLLCFVRDITDRKLAESQQQALQKLAHDLNESIDMHTVGQMAAKAIRSFFDSDAFAIEYYDLAKKSILGVYSEDTFRGNKVPREILAKNTPFSAVKKDFLKLNAFAHVRNRTKIELKSLRSNRPFGSSRLSHSLLFAPIIWEGENIGVLTVQSYTDNKFTNDDLANIQTFADQIGGALVRTRKDEALIRQQQALVEGEEKYRSMIENAGDALFVTTLKGKILAFNHHATHSLGYSEENLLKLNLKEINPWFKKALSRKQLLELATTSSSATIETVHLRKDGSSLPVELRVGTMELQGEPCILYFARDISERKESEVFYTALRKMARQLTVSLHPRDVGKIASSVLFNLFDHDAFVLNQINLSEQTAQSLYGEDTFEGDDRPRETQVTTEPFKFDGYREYLILPTPLLVNRNKKFKTPRIKTFGNHQRRSKSLVFVPIFWERKQIGVFSLQSYTANKFDQSDAEKLKVFANQIGGALVRAQTDMELSKQTTVLLERERELEAAVEEKEVLLKEVYHRTKNNMQVMIGLLEMHGFKTKHPQTQKVLDEMVHRITSMSMVHDLLYRSKNLSEITLDTYLEKLSSRLITAYKMSSGDITLHFEVEPTPINIQFAVPLGLVINEIISNTLKHAFPANGDGNIYIRSKFWQKTGLDLVISDDGVGLGSTQNLNSATTMGLRIIQDIVELQLFGEISSTSNRGVKYHLRIPNLNLE